MSVRKNNNRAWEKLSAVTIDSTLPVRLSPPLADPQRRAAGPRLTSPRGSAAKARMSTSGCRVVELDLPNRRAQTRRPTGPAFAAKFRRGSRSSDECVVRRRNRTRHSRIDVAHIVKIVDVDADMTSFAGAAFASAM
jgi:hypothetical protein